MSEEDKAKIDQPEVEETEQGHASSPQTSSFERRKTARKIVFGSIFLLLAGTAYGIYHVSTRSNQVAQRPTQLPPSEPTFVQPTKPAEVVRSVPSRLEVTPPLMSFGNLTTGAGREYKSIVVKAVHGPVNITQVTLPFAEQSGLDMRSTACIKQLAEGESCAISVQFAPVTPVVLSNQILINGSGFDMSGDTQGASRNVSATVEINGSAVAPPPPPPPPPAPVVIDTRASQLASNQEDYLRRRQQPGAFSGQTDTGYRAPRKPYDQDWASVGFRPNQSTLPVDMTRVVTMDKPIPAVIKIAIDTRRPSRAVATVERDIYGGDGRTVLIERGSTMIGRVGSISETSEETVGIQWQRLVRPDGAAFSFEATSGDAMGRSGVLAHIDNRFFERFGKTALASVLSAGITIALNPNEASVTTNGTTASGFTGTVSTGGTTTTQRDARSIANQQLRQDFQPLYEQFKKEQLAIPPIRNVPAGTRITIWPTTDLWLRQVPADEPVAAPDARPVQQVYRGPSQAPQAPAPAAQPQAQQPAYAPQPQPQTGVYGQGYGDAAPISPDVDTNLESSTASQKLRDELNRQPVRLPESNPYGAPGVAGAAAQPTTIPPWAQSR